MPKKFLEAGKIVGTHGIRGDLKVQSWCDYPVRGIGTFVITEDTSTPLWVWIASGGAALLALCAVLLIHKARKKKRKAA